MRFILHTLAACLLAACHHMPTTDTTHTETRPLSGPFHTIQASGPMHLILGKGNALTLTISGPASHIPPLKIEVQNGVLRLEAAAGTPPLRIELQTDQLKGMQISNGATLSTR